MPQYKYRVGDKVAYIVGRRISCDLGYGVVTRRTDMWGDPCYMLETEGGRQLKVHFSDIVEDSLLDKITYPR